MDDLVTDHLREQNKLLEKQSKQAKAKAKKQKKNTSSYDDEDRKEAFLTKIVEKCHNQAK